jgi:class 3 adenylate cyclase
MGVELRASDADRERVAGVLREHFSAGRLSDEELSDRVDRVYSARTVLELEDLTLDLPAPEKGLPVEASERRPAPRYTTRAGRALRTSVKIHATIYTLVNLMLVGIWAASGGGEFWPIWSILGWGIGLGAHAAPVMAGVGRRSVHHRPRPQLGPASADDLAERVQRDRPNLSSAAAPDGTVTILFSDIADSTALNTRLGDVRWLELLRAHHALVREQFERHAGFEVKAQGDGFMVAFPSARRAVQCAQAIQTALAAEFDTHPDGPIRVRIGLHTGEAVREEDDFYGKNVVLAARIAAQAGPGEILTSTVVKELVESGGDISFGDGREVELKGLGPYRLHTVD